MHEKLMILQTLETYTPNLISPELGTNWRICYFCKIKDIQGSFKKYVDNVDVERKRF